MNKDRCINEENYTNLLYDCGFTHVRAAPRYKDIFFVKKVKKKANKHAEY